MLKPGFFAGLAGAGILRAAWRLTRFVCKWIATVIMYFGLYIPGLYLVYGIVLHFTLGVRLFDFSTDSQLYLLGMVLCLTASAIIAVRHLVIAPIKSVLKFRDRHAVPEQPLVYRSEVNPSLIIYEYDSRYDVYRIINGRLTFLRSEAKGCRY